MTDERHERLAQAARAARRAGWTLGQITGPERRQILLAMADVLERPDVRSAVAKANGEDLAEGAAARDRGELAQALVDRLVLDDRKLTGVIDGLRQLAAQPDPLGKVAVDRDLDDDLVLRRVACPLGVVAVIFEARPDALVQIVGLAMRSGNAVVLKGGREAAKTNAVLAEALRRALTEQGFDPGAVLLLEDRAEVEVILSLDRDIDLVVARGSSSFVRHIMATSAIPVLAHAEGICHVVLDAAAEPKMAAAITVDAKCGYPAACNAAEALLWMPGAEAALDATVAALRERGVELRACPATLARHPDLVAATDADFGFEFGALVLAIKRVDDLAAALAHIEQHGSRHTEAIVTGDLNAAETFLARVDAACVFHNASTRFADGYRFGLGAEVGISTSKLHARGPVGAEGLITYRWLLRGGGQVAGDYGPGKRRFRHRDRSSQS